MFSNILPAWLDLLADYIPSTFYSTISAKVEQEYARKIIYPPRSQVLRVLKTLAPQDVKVIILGQDPYHGPKQANGLSFSVNEGQKLPPSLQNIYRELYDDLGIKPRSNGDLSSWLEQGVCLLNTTLTVEAGKPNSHYQLGWYKLSDAIVKALATLPQAKVFILWGNLAIAKQNLIEMAANPENFILKSPHPSPLSAHRGFFGSKPFSKSNEFLCANGLKPINW